MHLYHELLNRQDAPPGSAWGLFGEGDELGTLNHLTPAHVRKAVSLIRMGTVFNLDYPINAFEPYPSGTRFQAVHKIFQTHPHNRDDLLDGLYLQSTTQIDGLRHIRHPMYGFYGWTDDNEVQPGSSRLGIQHSAEQGIVGRGVLVDVERSLALAGTPIDQRENFSISVEDILRTAEQQGVSFQPGDLLLIRTGWTRFFLEDMSPSERQALPGNLRCPGIEQSEEMIAWLWDSRFSLVAADNFALEAMPPIASSPYLYTDSKTGVSLAPEVRGMIHPQLISLLGFCIGEMWSLEELATACAEDGNYDFMMVVKPLNVRGGVGSPANATAIK